MKLQVLVFIPLNLETVVMAGPKSMTLKYKYKPAPKPTGRQFIFKTEKRKNGSFVYFQCSKRRCRYKVALHKDTVFENSNLKMSQIFLLAYCFTQFLPYKKVKNEVPT